MNIKRHIPNIITLLNLSCGFLSILLACRFELKYAAMMILLASVFDFFDGMAARALKTKSEIGKELDSLCDIVSFGVAPAIILYQLLSMQPIEFPQWVGIQIPAFIVAVLFPCFAAIRLAKFNIDTKQSEIFYGLPTPAAAFAIASFPFYDISLSEVSFYTYSAICLLLCFAMVSNFPMLSLKFRDFTIKNNIARYLLLVVGLILCIWLKFRAIAPIIACYLLFSIIFKNRIVEQKKE